MKRSTFVIVLLGSIVLFSCHKKESFYPMYATINGAPFKGTNCIVHKYTGVFSIYGGFFFRFSSYNSPN